MTYKIKCKHYKPGQCKNCYILAKYSYSKWRECKREGKCTHFKVTFTVVRPRMLGKAALESDVNKPIGQKPP